MLSQTLFFFQSKYKKKMKSSETEYYLASNGTCSRCTSESLGEALGSWRGAIIRVSVFLTQEKLARRHSPTQLYWEGDKLSASHLTQGNRLQQLWAQLSKFNKTLKNKPSAIGEPLSLSCSRYPNCKATPHSKTPGLSREQCRWSGSSRSDHNKRGTEMNWMTG